MGQATRHVADSDEALVTVPLEDDRPTTQTVVETVAAVEGVDATDLSTPLYDSVDPDALDSLCAVSNERDPPMRVEFRYAGYLVCVQAGKQVVVRE